MSCMMGMMMIEEKNECPCKILEKVPTRCTSCSGTSSYSEVYFDENGFVYGRVSDYGSSQECTDSSTGQTFSTDGVSPVPEVKDCIKYLNKFNCVPSPC